MQVGSESKSNPSQSLLLDHWRRADSEASLFRACGDTATDLKRPQRCHDRRLTLFHQTSTVCLAVAPCAQYPWRRQEPLQLRIVYGGMSDATGAAPSLQHLSMCDTPRVILNRFQPASNMPQDSSCVLAARVVYHRFTHLFPSCSVLTLAMQA